MIVIYVLLALFQIEFQCFVLSCVWRKKEKRGEGPSPDVLT